MPNSPTQRSLALLKKEGYLAQVVEQYIRTGKGGFRRDLFGFLDIVAIKAGRLRGIQATSLGNISHRIKKIQESEAYEIWQTVGETEVHGWVKRAEKKGSKRKTWQVRIVNDAEIHLYGRGTTGDDLEATPPDDS